MSDSILSAPYFHDEEAAYDFVEARIWPCGPVCPHCGGVEKNRTMQGNSHSHRRVQVLRLPPQAIYREDRHHLRGQPYSDAGTFGVFPQ